MTQDECQYYINKLGQAFGKSEKQINSLIDIYHEQLSKRLDSRQLSKTVEFLLSNADRFPTIKEIFTASQMFPRPVNQHTHIECTFCWGDGTVRVMKDGYRSIWKCPLCDNYQADYPLWNDEFYMQGYSKVYPTTWDANDEWIVKGLSLLGPESIPWKKATEECRKVALKFMQDNSCRIKSAAGFSSAADALVSTPDAQKEAERQKHIDWVEREERASIQAESEEFPW